MRNWSNMMNVLRWLLLGYFGPSFVSGLCVLGYFVRNLVSGIFGVSGNLMVMENSEPWVAAHFHLEQWAQGKKEKKSKKS